MRKYLSKIVTVGIIPVAFVLSLVMFPLPIVSGQTWTQQATLSVEPAFVERVKMAIVSAAVSISNEADTTPNHVNRVQLARQVVSNPVGWASQFAVGVAADATVNSASTDTVINNRVSAICHPHRLHRSMTFIVV